jgi:phage-related protein
MNIEFLEISRGESPVFEFLNGLEDQKAHKKIQRDLGLIQKYSFPEVLRAGLMIKMTGSEIYKLYEYKVLYNKKQYRIMCCVNGPFCYLVHAFIKKTQKTPLKHLQISISRIKSHNLHK